MMQFFHNLMEGAALIIDVVASVIMVWAFLVAVYAFVQASLRGAAAERIMGMKMARCDLGVKLVFALELLIISDLLHTVVSTPSMICGSWQRWSLFAPLSVSS